MSLPKVSIITVVYNGEKYLEETITSVIEQDYPKIEHIIIDGGSTDNTLKIIKKYEKNIDFWISEKDNGLSDAMNKGVAYAKGDFVMHLHADDKLKSEKSISNLVELLSCNNDKKWATGLYLYINSDGQFIRKDVLREYSFNDMLLRNIIRHQTTLVPRQALLSFPFSSNYKYAMDYDFFLKLWSTYGSPCYYLADHISYFRLDGTNLSSNYIASLKDEMRVRRDYRKNNKQNIWILFDVIIYILRYLKIIVYHTNKLKKNVR